MKKVIKPEQLKTYLLGIIPQEDAREIDLEIITNAEFEENLQIAEELLIEDYIEGELTSDEKNLFLNNFLTTKKRAQQFKTIAQLKKYSQGINFDNFSTNEDKSKEQNLIQRILNLFQMIPAPAFAAVLLVGFITLLAVFIYQNNGLSKIELEYAELNKENIEEISKNEKYSQVVLISGQTRSDEESRELIKLALTEKVLFNLALNTKPKSKETYKIELLQGEDIIFTLNQIIPLDNKYEGELSFLLPEKVLESGQYELRVTSNDNSDNKLIYTFNVK